MGFVRREVWLVVFWQTTALVVVALLIGLPLGVLRAE
jgi:ABC-type lipoprotein release transport system permease subunit